jgi:hypothetical protein
MHASVWRFFGDPDDLLERYDRLVAMVPQSSMHLHLCLKEEDGIVLIDTCPSKEAFDAFFADFGSALTHVGLPEPVVADNPVHVAFVDGERR